MQDFSSIKDQEFMAAKRLRAVEPQEKILNHEGAKDAKKNIF